MRARIGHFSLAGTLITLAFFSSPGALPAQRPVVTSAVLTWVPAPTLIPSDSMVRWLILRIEGLSMNQLKALRARDLVVADAAGYLYTPRALAIDAIEARQPERFSRQYIYEIVPGQTTFELRLPGFAPVPFQARENLRQSTRRPPSR